MMRFEDWAAKHLPGNSTERDLIVWEAARAYAVVDCVGACVSERLEESPSTPEDAAYEQAVDDCVSAIRSLATPGAPPTTPNQRRINALRRELQVLLDAESVAAGAELEALKVRCVSIAQAGKPMEAAKVYRAGTGLSLREAHDAVVNLVDAANKLKA